jgi:hypothetical protein
MSEKRSAEKIQNVDQVHCRSLEYLADIEVQHIFVYLQSLDCLYTG